jgi:hypothetical protein
MIRLVATLALLAVGMPGLADDYQKVADEAKWDWQAEKATVLHSVLNFQGDYQIEVVKRPNSFGDLTVRFTKDGKDALTLKGHYATAFVGKGTILYYTEHDVATTGCALVAFDLAKGKELWKTKLMALGPIAHFGYRNHVALEVVGDAAKVLGNETAGQYVEFVNLKTGKTVGHRIFRKGFER